MKAAIYDHYGPPEVVSVHTIPKPIPKENQVLIKVHASTVNRTDCGFRSAEYFISRFWSGLIRPKFASLGCEYAGTITEIGNAVRHFNIGDRVFGFNDKTFGGHAEFLCVGEDDAIAVLPSNIAFETAAALTEGSHYALVDIRAAKVTAGHNTIVYGATGAIGSAAVQLLKAMGARVTAVCAGPHVELVKSLGADQVLDYQKTDYRTLTEKFDFFFDAVGKSSFGHSKKVLTEKGIYISTELGKGGENIRHALISPLFGRQKLLFPIPTITKADVEYLRDLAQSGAFKPVIDRSYPLDQIVEAYHYVETGQKIGNVIIALE
jgi:NADPH:quinone reductase-like Zn-dependent oxidoreductase